MRKLSIIYFCLVTITFGIGINSIYDYIKPLEINYSWKDFKPSTYGEENFNFITKKLSREDGAIYTNYIDTPSQGEETKGHDILSESEGLIMLYSLEINNKNLFDKHFNLVENHMLLDNGLISWRISKDNIKNNTSALIDDLRIFKALILAYDRFGDYKYRFAATKMSKAILEKSTSKDILIDFNDSINKSNTLTLCYIDLESLNLLNKIHSKWNNINKNSKKILTDGLISPSVPLFRKNYNIDSNTYSNEKETELLYSLMCWENKKDAGEDITPIITWINDNIKVYGALYNKYNNVTGKPLDSIESTAIYAVASRLAYKNNDLQLYEKLSSLLLKFQVKDPSSAIYGSFGFAPREEAYSFDNLQSLLSLLKKSEK